MSVKKLIIVAGLIGIFSVQKLFSQHLKSPDTPKLIIGIVVEGMRQDYLNRYWNQFGKDGFRKIVENGSRYTNTNYEHLIMQSAPGYASIASGCSPSHHGIIADNWYQRLSGKQVNCVEDSKTSVLGLSENRKGASPKKMAVSTLGDQIKISGFNRPKVISISPEKHAAVLSGGHAADGAFWFDDESGNWVSSDYYFSHLPTWVKRFNNKRLASLYMEQPWELLQEQHLYKSSMNDESSYESGFEGRKTFPYDLSVIKYDYNGFELIMSAPAGNTLVKDFAVSAIVNEDLGRDEHTDLLILSFSANENIADKFGIRSLEIADAYIRLDQNIAQLLEFVNDYVGLENTLIYLTANRGAADTPKFLDDLRQPNGYFKERAAEQLLRSYMRALYDHGGFIQGFSAGQLYLQRTRIEDAKIDLSGVQSKAADFLVSFKGVASVVTGKDLETRNFSEGMLKKAQNSYYRKRSGDVSIILEANFKVEDSEDSFSPYKEFSHVPLIFYGWKIPHREIYRQVSPVDIAPTLAQIMKIAAPNASSGRILFELFVE